MLHWNTQYIIIVQFLVYSHITNIKKCMYPYMHVHCSTQIHANAHKNVLALKKYTKVLACVTTLAHSCEVLHKNTTICMLGTLMCALCSVENLDP